MSPNLRRVGLAFAASGIALSCTPATPASAVTAPSWPGARLPSGAGCAITSYTPFTDTASGLNEYVFTDSAVPVVTGWTVNGRTGSIALGPGSSLVTFRVNATQSCGGVGAVTTGVVVGSTRTTDGFPLVRDSADAFRSVWRATVTMSPASVGAYRVPSVRIAQRYASFVLTDTWRMVSATPYAGPATTVTGSWSNAVVYVRRATVQVPSASKAKVRKGRAVTVRTTLRRASASSYVAAGGALVSLQTKVGNRAWTTRTTLRTNAAGVAAYRFAPARTMSWRWVHAGTTSGTFTAPSSSATRKIRVR